MGQSLLRLREKVCNYNKLLTLSFHYMISNDYIWIHVFSLHLVGELFYSSTGIFFDENCTIPMIQQICAQCCMYDNARQNSWLLSTNP